jgi:hypothetical protein
MTDAKSIDPRYAAETKLFSLMYISKFPCLRIWRACCPLLQFMPYSQLQVIMFSRATVVVGSSWGIRPSGTLRLANELF